MVAMTDTTLSPSSIQIQRLRMKIAKKSKTVTEEWEMLAMLGLL